MIETSMTRCTSPMQNYLPWLLITAAVMPGLLWSWSPMIERLWSGFTAPHKRQHSFCFQPQRPAEWPPLMAVNVWYGHWWALANRQILALFVFAWFLISDEMTHCFCWLLARQGHRVQKSSPRIEWNRSTVEKLSTRAGTKTASGI